MRHVLSFSNSFNRPTISIRDSLIVINDFMEAENLRIVTNREGKFYRFFSIFSYFVLCSIVCKKWKQFGSIVFDFSIFDQWLSKEMHCGRQPSVELSSSSM
jgi:hypothetical protein